MSNRTSVSEAKHEQIFQAAVVEFQERGFRDASMDRISKQAGVSKRTVYRHFKSKEALFQELVRRHWRKFTDILEVKYDKSRDIRDQLTELGRAEGRLFTSPDIIAMTRLVMSEVLRSPELVEENEEKTDYKIHLEALLRDAAMDGQLRVADPGAAAEEFIALIKGKSFWPVVLGAPIVSEQQMEEAINSSVSMMMSRYAP